MEFRRRKLTILPKICIFRSFLTLKLSKQIFFTIFAENLINYKKGKKMIRFSSLAIALAASMAASGAMAVTPTSFCGAWKNVGTKASLTVSDVKLPALKAAPLTRSIDEPQTNFVATEASFYYYGDLLEDGSGVYYLFLSNAGINKGNPTHEGQMARIMIIGEQTDEAAPVFPTGTFKFTDDYGIGSISIEDSDFMDIFPNPDDETSLVAYNYIPVDATLKVEATEDGYSIDFSMEGRLYSYDDEIIDQQTCTAKYEGAVPYDDIYGYTPIDGDMTLDVPNASGRYTEGDFSIAFYSDGMLDEDGFIVSGGQLLNVELFTDEVSPMNLDLLTGTLSPIDAFEEGPVPGHFMQGIWYDIFGGFYAALGTSLSVYDNNGSVTEVGLATDGTITVTKEDDGIYTFDFDLITKEGSKMTGKWSGKIADYIEDFTAPESVSTITDAKVSAGKGCITAPENAEVYTMGGVKTGRNNLTSGVYFVKTNDSVVKVFVK